ncbi:response regulator [Terriglobus tenax]|uniref:response regulator n=1 Tax=Terriglobus tenax TaxID=1111115 RepID=UPI0021DFE407|nr:response regulator [Terriglobus tenax]
MRRILVVDDEHLVADTLRIIFRENGFDARAVYSAEDGLTAARDFHPNLLLCDVNMPGEDGVSLASRLSEEQPGCRILLFTGYYSLMKSLLDRSRTQAHPWSVLTKPLHPTELLREANALLA